MLIYNVGLFQKTKEQISSIFGILELLTKRKSKKKCQEFSSKKWDSYLFPPKSTLIAYQKIFSQYFGRGTSEVCAVLLDW